jgi:hypothetical protein
LVASNLLMTYSRARPAARCVAGLRQTQRACCRADGCSSVWLDGGSFVDLRHMPTSLTSAPSLLSLFSLPHCRPPQDRRQAAAPPPARLASAPPSSALVPAKEAGAAGAQVTRRLPNSLPNSRSCPPLLLCSAFMAAGNALDALKSCAAALLPPAQLSLLPTHLRPKDPLPSPPPPPPQAPPFQEGRVPGRRLPCRPHRPAPLPPAQPRVPAPQDGGQLPEAGAPGCAVRFVAVCAGCNCWWALDIFARGLL